MKPQGRDLTGEFVASAGQGSTPKCAEIWSICNTGLQCMTSNSGKSPGVVRLRLIRQALVRAMVLLLTEPALAALSEASGATILLIRPASDVDQSSSTSRASDDESSASGEKGNWPERLRLAQGDAPRSADENGTSTSAATTGKSSDTLEQVVVTATRRSESVEKVPISIKALSQRDLAEGAIKSIAELSSVTPGLQFGTPYGWAASITTISIRGINTNVGASPVGIYLDDMPLQVQQSPASNVGNPYPVVFDLNRVEVARGPQGTLFGAGSEAGTVRFITNEPSLTEFSGFSHVELATTQGGAPSYEIGAAGGGPIIQDRAGFRLGAFTRRGGATEGRSVPGWLHQRT
jgi:outer membrane receptor protein involved in Fe transport